MYKYLDKGFLLFDRLSYLNDTPDKIDTSFFDKIASINQL